MAEFQGLCYKVNRRRERRARLMRVDTVVRWVTYDAMMQLFIAMWAAGTQE